MIKFTWVNAVKFRMISNIGPTVFFFFIKVSPDEGLSLPMTFYVFKRGREEFNRK